MEIETDDFKRIRDGIYESYNMESYVKQNEDKAAMMAGRWSIFYFQLCYWAVILFLLSAL